MKRRGIVIGAAIAAPLVAAAALVWAFTLGTPSAPTASAYGSHLAELQALVGTQTPEEIEAVTNGGGSVHLLLDPATGATLAALRAGDAPG